MMRAKITPVVLSGGSGSRLWPLSRAGYPKQFHPLVDDHTMIQQTVERVSGEDFAAPLVICNEEHRFIVAEQLRQIGREPAAILLEPEGRNTAPAAALAALTLVAEDADAVMLVLPSDHVIGDEAGFRAAVARAAEVARAGHLVALGVEPDRPETGYGYIRVDGPLAGHDGAARIERFVEKPDLRTAEAFLAEGGYLWNSGIFVFSAAGYLEELARTRPAMVEACRAALAGARQDLTFTRVDAKAFKASPSDSIDYAVMEKTRNAAVVPIAFGWNDLGAWSALWDIGHKDGDGNVTRGDVLLHDTRDSYAHSDHPLVTVVGLEGVVVVATDDAVLVADRAKVQDVKTIVTRLKAEGREEHNLHTTVYRPWGCYRGIDRGERFQVKRITVQPGEKLSLQMHYHRAEHWIVVSGTALVTRGSEEFLLKENESTYISAGQTHRLENPGMLPLDLIEVQSGSYLGEDDIVRFEDSYQRDVTDRE